MINESGVDLIVRAARIHLLGSASPVEALLVRGGRVAAVGPFEAMRALAAPGARVEDLGAATVTPGLVDAHVHLTTWALSRRQVDLNACATLEDALAAIRGAAATGEGWVRGIGWDAHRWGSLPTRQELDAVSPE